MGKLIQYLLSDLLKNRIVIGSLVLFSVLGWGTFLIAGSEEKSLIILLQITLLALPLITMIFSSIYYYNAADLITILLSQPLKRSQVFRSVYLGLTATFILIYILGMGIPLLAYYPELVSLILLLSGILIVAVFIALALWISNIFRDKVRGIGGILILWVFFTFLFDGLLLYLMYQFSEYPIEKLILVLSFLNPIDIARIAVIMQTDVAALMGLSGAVFVDFFGNRSGMLISYLALLIWALILYIYTERTFNRKDF